MKFQSPAFKNVFSLLTEGVRGENCILFPHSHREGKHSKHNSSSKNLIGRLAWLEELSAECLVPSGHVWTFTIVCNSEKQGPVRGPHFRNCCRVPCRKPPCECDFKHTAFISCLSYVIIHWPECNVASGISVFLKVTSLPRAFWRNQSPC